MKLTQRFRWIEVRKGYNKTIYLFTLYPGMLLDIHLVCSYKKYRPKGGVGFLPRAIIWTFFAKKNFWSHTKYQSFEPCDFIENIWKCILLLLTMLELFIEPRYLNFMQRTLLSRFFNLYEFLKEKKVFKHFCGV